MTDHCQAIERLPEIAELPNHDPRRRHLGDCARCQSRLADYLDFMTAGAEVPQAGFDAAMARLEHSLAEAIHPDVKPFRPTPGRPFLNRPAVRGALAIAALFLLAFSMNGLWERRDSSEIRLRAPAGEPAGAEFEPIGAQWTGEGDLVLSWRAHPGGEDYIVRILGADLTSLAELPAGENTQLTVMASRLEELLAGETLFAWQVLALSGGDTIDRSVSVALRLDHRPTP